MNEDLAWSAALVIVFILVGGARGCCPVSVLDKIRVSDLNQKSSSSLNDNS